MAPAPAEQPRRYYFVVAVSPRGRESLPSTPVAVPLDAAPSAPGAPVVTYTASGLSVTWAPSPDARTATLEPPSPVAAAPPAAATPANATPAAPVTPALPLLAAKSLGFTTLATTYHLYEVPAEPPAEDPFALAAPVGAHPAAADGHRVRAIPGVTFGVERCFVTRAVDVVAGAAGAEPAIADDLRDAARHLPARRAPVAGGHRGRGRDQPDLGAQRRGRPGRLSRVARRGAG